MNTEHLREVLSWIKSTDLVEVSYKKGTDGFSLSSVESPQQNSFPVPTNRYIPICSPTVGIFQFNEKGQARAHEEGAEVAEGDLLGLIETVKGKSTPLKAPSAGRLSRVMIEGGAAVEFGQPLFFLEPR